MSFSYFQDSYGNEYQWSTTKQADGKFHIRFLKLKKEFGRTVLKLVKERSFKQRQKAKAYCLKAYRKAKERQAPILKKRNEKYQIRESLRRKRQDEVLKKRNEKKQERLALQPKGKEKSKIEAKNKVKHLKELIKKIDTKTKSLKTRRKTYAKKLKYYEKRVASMKDVYISKNRNIPKYSEIED
jgi:hypothetical protein